MKSKLAESVLFSGFDAGQLEQIAATGQKLKIERGRFVFMQEDPADLFFIVIEGKIKIAKIAPDGKEQILMLAGPGDSFGEAAFFAGVNYPAGAEALIDSSLIAFHRNKFMALMKERPELAFNMISRLSTLLHHMTRLVQGLSLEDVGTRLARYLIDLIPENTADGGPIEVELTEKKTVLASLLGTIPETLSRTFARLADLDIVAVNGSRITIKNLARLAEIAEGRKI